MNWNRNNEDTAYEARQYERKETQRNLLALANHGLPKSAGPKVVPTLEQVASMTYEQAHTVFFDLWHFSRWDSTTRRSSYDQERDWLHSHMQKFTRCVCSECWNSPVDRATCNDCQGNGFVMTLLPTNEVSELPL